ncbi:hypothetical protein N658DRAFT_497140 [Parathielavia hyrcaniae]|uniref:Uncharacterized protein n=1 Tax=Parathielavia hyrcaniae TaxID=113614 RepID=A0AAN6Q489_9PEZI|nr:hypothetical protein N658DRAFT_497140 [Parathielavia hyrcaniae]
MHLTATTRTVPALAPVLPSAPPHQPHPDPTKAQISGPLTGNMKQPRHLSQPTIHPSIHPSNDEAYPPIRTGMYCTAKVQLSLTSADAHLTVWVGRCGAAARKGAGRGSFATQLQATYLPTSSYCRHNRLSSTLVHRFELAQRGTRAGFLLASLRRWVLGCPTARKSDPLQGTAGYTGDLEALRRSRSGTISCPYCAA